jgi:urease accessory protein
VRGRAAVVAEPDGHGGTRLTTLRSEPPILLRPTPQGLYLAASAAGPLGGDEITLQITVAAGARLTVRTVAAALALPGRGGTSILRLELSAEGHLAVLPEPTIVADNATHHTLVEAGVGAGGALIVREEAILGRHGELGGRYRSTMHVDAAGLPLLRSDLSIDGADPTTTGPAAAIAGRATGALLLAGGAVPDRPPAAHDGTAAMPLAGPGWLVTAIAADGRTLREQLDSWLPATASLVG